MSSSQSPKVVVNPYAAAGASSAAASGTPTPPPSPYVMQAMALELQRSQQALARLRAENRKFREKEELENAPMSGGILAWSEKKAVNVMASANTLNGLALIAAAVGSFFIPGDTTASTFARVVLVCYMVFLGCVMIVMELHIGNLQVQLRDWLGFLFTYNGRSCFIGLCVRAARALPPLPPPGLRSLSRWQQGGLQSRVAVPHPRPPYPLTHPHPPPTPRASGGAAPPQW